MNVHVIGTGYVGLVTALALTQYGNSVTCWDINYSTINSLNGGDPHFYEPGLKELLDKSLARKLIKFEHIDNYFIPPGVDLIFIAVGTPSQKSSIDLSFVTAASRLIAENLPSSSSPTVVVKSTVTPGTTLGLVKRVLQESSKFDTPHVSVAMNPEFLREGSAVMDAINPDRIVIGCDDDIGFSRLNNLYMPFGAQIIRTSPSTAEFSKYCNNVYLALQISMANELSRIAAADPSICLHDAFQVIKADHRWAHNTGDSSFPAPITSYVYPGCGFGGSCFPKDVEAVANYANASHLSTPILNAILEINNSQPTYSVSLIDDWLLKPNARILLLGISFKPETDDCRESPAIKIIRNLLDRGHYVSIHDPMVDLQKFALENFPSESLALAESLDQGVSLAEIIFLCTPWHHYRQLHRLQIKYPSRKIFDARSALQNDSFDDWEYRSLANKEISQ